MGDRRGQIDMAHPLAPDFRLNHFDTALLADHAAMAHALVLAAITLIVLGRSEDLRAEEAVAFGLEGPVVDRLRLLDLAVRPRADQLGRGDRDADRVEGKRILRLLEYSEKIFHACSSFSFR